ncbi:hypothetical protein SJI00_07310 [Pseudomonas sp. RP23018S]|uniref:hypothetical protein n=1 Tax=Pseudomonas sp. RP23018S TaxID=3096037 RepID=UPI002ACA6803|nr:hypothetical protein [Pseudomonas sp. RP23018S]MDZ5602578.1 hypothetical protein [Pseudomonas sp. RP23018S]
MDTNKMREQFEVAMRGMTFSVDLSRGNHGCYLTLRTHELYCSWVASWQSSREAVVVELPPKPEVPEDPEEAIDDSHMDAYHSAIGMRHACAQCIKAAGLKVKP